MTYILSLGIIVLFSFLGEVLKAIIPLPIPANIYGMILLFLALCFKIIKVERINTVAHYLISIMLMFFIMPAVSIMDSFNLIKDNLISILIAIIVPTIAVVVVSALVTQWIEKISCKKEKKEDIKLLGNGK